MPTPTAKRPDAAPLATLLLFPPAMSIRLSTEGCHLARCCLPVFVVLRFVCTEGGIWKGVSESALRGREEEEREKQRSEENAATPSSRKNHRRREKNPGLSAAARAPSRQTAPIFLRSIVKSASNLHFRSKNSKSAAQKVFQMSPAVRGLPPCKKKKRVPRAQRKKNSPRAVGPELKRPKKKKRNC